MDDDISGESGTTAAQRMEEDCCSVQVFVVVLRIITEVFRCLELLRLCVSREEKITRRDDKRSTKGREEKGSEGKGTEGKENKGRKMK